MSWMFFERGVEEGGDLMRGKGKGLNIYTCTYQGFKRNENKSFFLKFKMRGIFLIGKPLLPLMDREYTNVTL